MNAAEQTHLQTQQEFLSFVLGDEHYALEITAVKEIRGYEPVTKIANAPDFIKGVLNLRGDIVPIIDLRIKFNIGTLCTTSSPSSSCLTCLIA